MNIFVNSRRELRNGWWVAVFFVVLAAMLFPLIVFTKERGATLPVEVQAVIVVIASVICQRIRRRPLRELTGSLDWRWLRDAAIGAALGAALMIIPAMLLFAGGAVTWRFESFAPLAAAASLCIAVAVTEEFLFRGFIFQRLIDGIGAIAAQLLLAAYFVLTHASALATSGEVRVLATVNIFVASLLFGFAWLRTRSLAMPIAMHFAANLTQGVLLGFGVSGSSQRGVLVANMGNAPQWLTGGTFGLEASAPGLATLVVITLLFVVRRKGDES